MNFVPTVSVKLVSVPYYHNIFSRIMCILIALSAICLNPTIFLVNFNAFSAILLVKITNIWDTIL